MRCAVTLTLLWLLAVSARADLRVAWIFQDNAVLQRECPVPVWGEADAGSRVVVTYRDARAEGVADPAGRWRVTLPPLPASRDGALLTVEAGSERTSSDERDRRPGVRTYT